VRITPDRPLADLGAGPGVARIVTIPASSGGVTIPVTSNAATTIELRLEGRGVQMGAATAVFTGP
jgi:hypothetical protein